MAPDTVLPTLTLVGGRVMAAETGEVLDVEDPEVATELFGETLETFARARIEADALQMQLEDIEAMALSTARATEKYKQITARHQVARDTMARIEATLDGMFGERDAKVSIDTGRVLVTWGKPRETWSLAKPASWYATGKARYGLQQLLAGYLNAEGDEPFIVATANAVLNWLAPTAKVSEPGAPSITVRANGAGR